MILISNSICLNDIKLIFKLIILLVLLLFIIVLIILLLMINKLIVLIKKNKQKWFIEKKLSIYLLIKRKFKKYIFIYDESYLFETI